MENYKELKCIKLRMKHAVEEAINNGTITTHKSAVKFLQSLWGLSNPSSVHRKVQGIRATTIEEFTDVVNATHKPIEYFFE